MTTLQALILGIVQGIAEFLPISSSGHLIVLQRVFGIEEPHVTFDIFLHVGSLVAIVIVFWKDILEILKNPLSKMTGLLIVGSIPAVVAGVIMYTRGILENSFRSGLWLACAFIVTGVFLLLADKILDATKEAASQLPEGSGSGINSRCSGGDWGGAPLRTEREMTYMDAIVIGFFQALALPPGISRSGTTIMGGLSRGLNRKTAAKFSFMLAIIAIAGAGLLDLVASLRGSGYDERFADAAYIGAVPMIVGFVASVVVGYFSIRLLLELINKCKLKYFSFYVWGLAALVLVDYFIVNRFF